MKNAKDLFGKFFTFESDLTKTTNNKSVKNNIIRLKIEPTTKFFSLFTSKITYIPVTSHLFINDIFDSHSFF